MMLRPVGYVAAVVVGVMLAMPWAFATQAKEATRSTAVVPAVEKVPVPQVPQGVEHIAHGRFEDVRLYTPHDPVRHVAIYFSGMSGWKAEDDARSRALSAAGNLVIGVDSDQFFEAMMAEDAEECEFTDGDIENLSHFVQAYAKLPDYHLPVLVGLGSAASFVYANLAQAPADTFAGIVTRDFCPELMLRKPMCEAEHLEFEESDEESDTLILSAADTLGRPWMNFRSPAAEACDTSDFRALVHQMPPAAKGSDGTAELLAAFNEVIANTVDVLRETPGELTGLPIEEVKATGKESDMMAVFISGDGGWAGIDKDVAAALAAQGIPVAGWDSLRYFWTPRTPDGVAKDADRIIAYYSKLWNKKRVILIGYSQGANVMPFVINRLPEASKAKVVLTAMMGLEEQANFEFHLASWVSDTKGRSVRSEIEKLGGAPAICIYGQDDEESYCPRIKHANVQEIRMKGGHHFDGNYDELAALILRKVMP